MKRRIILAAIAFALSLPVATRSYAQDDDIYYSPKAEKKTVYAQTASQNWSTNANNDWSIDDYNRRGSGSSTATTVSYSESSQAGGSSVSYQQQPQVVHDTVVVVEQYYYTDLIRRFHNPLLTFHYSPYYDIAFYDPFYWDRCYWDPWWYVTPSFGFHYGGWYHGWNYGYYCGWYGGWYAPYYRPWPHHHMPYYGHHGIAHHANYRPRNNFGGRFVNHGGRASAHFANRGGSRRGDSNYSRRGEIRNNGGGHNGGPQRAIAAPQGRTRNTAQSMRQSNLRQNATVAQDLRQERAAGMRTHESGQMTVRAEDLGRTRQQAQQGSHTTTRTYNNSASRRDASGIRQNDRGATSHRVRETTAQRHEQARAQQNAQREANRQSYQNNQSNRSYNSNSSTRSNSNSSSHSFSGGSNRGGGGGGSFRSSGGGGGSHGGGGGGGGRRR